MCSGDSQNLFKMCSQVKNGSKTVHRGLFKGVQNSSQNRSKRFIKTDQNGSQTVQNGSESRQNGSKNASKRIMAFGVKNSYKDSVVSHQKIQ